MGVRGTGSGSKDGADAIRRTPETRSATGYSRPSSKGSPRDDAQAEVQTRTAKSNPDLAGGRSRRVRPKTSSPRSILGAAFVGGNGVSKPRGFLAAPNAAAGDVTRAFGTLQYIASGAAGAFAANPEEKLIDLVQALRPPYRQGASWVMNSATLARVRKFRTSDGALLWQPGLAAGQPATLLGYPVVEAEDMPDIAANSLAIAFGNFRAGYLVVERGETQVLRDPYSNKPFVHFYATKRVGGMVSNSEAIKLLRFSAA